MQDLPNKHCDQLSLKCLMGIKFISSTQQTQEQPLLLYTHFADEETES
jgi:hypothetical protein